jgi:hypothetical protein
MQEPPDLPTSNDPFSSQPSRLPENSSPITPPPLPARGPVISFDVIGDAWNLFRADMAIWMGAAFLYLVVSSALTFWMLATLPDPATGRQFSPTFFVALLVFGLVATFFHGGMFRIALGQIRSGRARFGDFWSSIDVFPALFVVTFLEVLAIIAGSCFCLLPGLLLMGLLLFAAPLVVDPQKKMGVMASLSTSFQVLKPQMWMALAFALVCYLLANAGQMLCGIGIIVSLPLFYLAITLAYRDFFFSDQSPPSISPMAWQAPPPIADPNR